LTSLSAQGLISPTSASHCPTAMTILRKSWLPVAGPISRAFRFTQVSCAAPCMTSHATVFSAGRFTIPFLASETSMDFPTCSKTLMLY
jgi:hypothetical protein